MTEAVNDRSLIHIQTAIALLLQQRRHGVACR